MGDRLVHADRPAELLTTFRLLDAELERLRGNADGFERESCQLLVFGCVRVEELLAAVRTSRLLEQHRALEEAEVGELVASPPPVRENGARFAAQQLLF